MTTYCGCGCAQRVHDLEASLSDLRDKLERDIARESVDRQADVRSIRRDIGDLLEALHDEQVRRRVLSGRVDLHEMARR